MRKIRAMFPFLLVIVIAFYLLPLLIKDTGTAMAMLLMIIPLICFVCSVVYGIKNSFHILFALLVAIIFVPSVFIFYNMSAWVYIAGYGIIALIGNAVGMIFFRRKK